MKRPTAPRIGQVTHHSIELTWEDALQRANDGLAAAAVDAVSKQPTGDGRVKVQLEQRDYRYTGTWTSVYM